MAIILTPDKTRNENGLVIHEKIIPDGSSLKANLKLSNGTGKVQGVCIHNTDKITTAANTTPAEQYTRATFNGNMNRVCVHYYVDDACAWQNLKENEIGWHAGEGNNRPGNGGTIAIEIIMNGSGDAKDKKAEENGALLAAILLKRHGLSVEEMHSHYFYSPIKKNCPLYIRPHWEQFASKVQRYYDKIGQVPSTTGKLYRVQLGAFKDKSNADRYMKQIKEKGFDAFVVSDSAFHRVQVGAFSIKDNAIHYQKKLAAAGFNDSIIKEV